MELTRKEVDQYLHDVVNYRNDPALRRCVEFLDDEINRLKSDNAHKAETLRHQHDCFAEVCEENAQLKAEVQRLTDELFRLRRRKSVQLVGVVNGEVRVAYEPALEPDDKVPMYGIEWSGKTVVKTKEELQPKRMYAVFTSPVLGADVHPDGEVEIASEPMTPTDQWILDTRRLLASLIEENRPKRLVVTKEIYDALVERAGLQAENLSPNIYQRDGQLMFYRIPVVCEEGQHICLTHWIEEAISPSPEQPPPEKINFREFL